LKCHNIQSDSPSILTPVFSLNNEFIRIVIFRMLKYTHIVVIMILATYNWITKKLLRWRFIFDYLTITERTKAMTEIYIMTFILYKLIVQYTSIYTGCPRRIIIETNKIVYIKYKAVQNLIFDGPDVTLRTNLHTTVIIYSIHLNF